MAATVLMDQGRLSLAEAAVCADTLALLVEDGQDDAPVVLLSRVVDRLTAERVRRALLGRLGTAEDRLAAAVEEVFRTAVELPAGELPAWAETGSSTRPAIECSASTRWTWTRPSWRTGRPGRRSR